MRQPTRQQGRAWKSACWTGHEPQPAQAGSAPDHSGQAEPRVWEEGACEADRRAGKKLCRIQERVGRERESDPGTQAPNRGDEHEEQGLHLGGKKLFCYLLFFFNYFFQKWAILGLFFVHFRLFKQTFQFLKQINVKNVHQVCGAGIRNHNDKYMSLLP